MKYIFVRSILGLLFLALANLSLATEINLAPIVKFDQLIHFLAVDDSDVFVPPGTYQLEVAEEWLRLIPGNRRDALLLQAHRSTHTERVEEPVALSIPSDQDRHYLVLLLPGGKTFTASGTYSGVRSRASVSPSFNRTTLHNALVIKQQTIASSKPLSQTATGPSTHAQVQVLGAPPPPILNSPGQSATVSTWKILFQWQPGRGSPSATSLRLCVAEERQPCGSLGISEHSVVLHQNPQTHSYEIHGLPSKWKGTRLTWSVASCAPNAQAKRIHGTEPPLDCTYAARRSLTWNWSISAPSLKFPAPNAVVNSYPNLQIQTRVPGADQYLFCVAKPSVQCPLYPASHGNGFVVQNTYNHEINSLLWREELKQFEGQTVNWTAAACEGISCQWAAPRPITFLPKPLLQGPLSYRFINQPHRSFTWTLPSGQQQGVTHYRFCLATKGNWKNGGQLIGTFWEVLEGLCGGRQTGYADGVINPGSSGPFRLCPGGNCRKPRQLGVWQTSQPRFVLDLINNPQLSAYANEDLTWTVGACTQNECTWQTEIIGTLRFPSAPGAPTITDPAPPSYVPQYGIPVEFHWSPSSVATYMVPCLTNINQRCVDDNELYNPRLRPSNSTNPLSLPSSCTLRGPYPNGPKKFKVAACHPVWGCRWSTNGTTVNFNPAGQYQGSFTRLECR